MKGRRYQKKVFLKYLFQVKNYGRVDIFNGG